MNDLGKHALTFAANLSIPTFQVIVVHANLRCSHCRLRATQIISKMAGSKGFMVDVCRKEVIVRGDIRLNNKHKAATIHDDVLEKMKMDKSSSVMSSLFKFLIRTSFGFLRIRCCWSDRRK